MSARPHQPEPFLRGCLYPALSEVSYPRAHPNDREHLPSDVWQSAQVPAGVRLEFVGEVDAVRIFYKTTTANLGYRGEGAGCTFSVFRSGQKMAEEEAVLGEGVVQLPLSGEPGRPAIVYLPEGMKPVVTGIDGVGGFIEPAPRQPRWLCYGDAVTQGWLASSPSLAWPVVAARKLGLDLCNLGYAGSTRSDTAAAVTLADTPADLVSISLGANNWGKFPQTPALCAEEIRATLSLVRAGHPNAPIVVISPLLRPDAEDTPNRLGVTLTELRIAMEEAVRERMIAGDVRLHLVEGSTVVGAPDLSDGRYPGDDGHIRIAAAVGKVISPLVAELRANAETRWHLEEQAALRLESPQPQLPSTDFLRQVGIPGLAPQAPVANPPVTVPAAASYDPPVPMPAPVPAVHASAFAQMPPPPPQQPQYQQPQYQPAQYESAQYESAQYESAQYEQPQPQQPVQQPLQPQQTTAQILAQAQPQQYLAAPAGVDPMAELQPTSYPYGPSVAVGGAQTPGTGA